MTPPRPTGSTPAATSEQVRPAIELALRGLTQLHTGLRVVGQPGAPPRATEIERFTPLLTALSNLVGGPWAVQRGITEMSEGAGRRAIA